ncbi:MAG TPA: hypothetical protein VNN17_09915 [Terriglobia bacterium]|nr:hypothetical protein [Terriglobia bacterium]
MSFPLENARLCMDCDTVFDEPRCPRCDSESFFPLSRWIRPAVEQKPAKPAPRSLSQKARNTSLLLGGAGLAYALWKFLTTPEKKPPAGDSRPRP